MLAEVSSGYSLMMVKCLIFPESWKMSLLLQFTTEEYISANEAPKTHVKVLVKLCSKTRGSIVQALLFVICSPYNCSSTNVMVLL